MHCDTAAMVTGECVQQMRAAGARSVEENRQGLPGRSGRGETEGKAHSAWVWLMEVGAWEVAVSAGRPSLHSHRGHTQSSPDEYKCEQKGGGGVL